jgi:predicted deacylase
MVKLKLRTIAGQAPGPHLLITGGVHGDEFEPMIAIRRLMGIVERELLRGKLTLVPVVNEAAFTRGSRVADDGLDLARTCPGKIDGTVTEQTAFALAELIRSADYYIDLHTGGTTLSVWPMTGYMLHALPDVLDTQRAMALAFNLPVIWGTDPALDGRSLSAARDANVPAIYAEYLGGGRCSEDGVRAYVEGCLNVMAMLTMIERPPNEGSAVRWIAEDPRPNSGHMQRCYPSPSTGCFETAVELGQPIEAGQVLGVVVDCLGHERHEVRSSQTGRVLVLRTFPAVQQGDSLAVILELDPAALEGA